MYLGIPRLGVVNRKSGAAGVVMPTPLIRISAQSVIGTADGVTITAISNTGSGGATYDATSDSGSPPVKQTASGNPVMRFNTTTAKSLQLANFFDAASNSSLFMVADQTSTRCVVWGGGAVDGTGSCFFGYGADDGSTVLYRNSGDSGLTQGSLSAVTGLKVFGLVIGADAGTLTYYDNSTTGVGASGTAGTFRYRKIGARDSGGSVDAQPSGADIAEAIYYNSALSASDAAAVITTLKTLYGIA